MIACGTRPLKVSGSSKSSEKYARRLLNAGVPPSYTIRSKIGSIRWFQRLPLSVCSSESSGCWILRDRDRKPVPIRKRSQSSKVDRAKARMGNSDAAARKIDAKKVGKRCAGPGQNRSERSKPLIA
jgi:hypothetical protein